MYKKSKGKKEEVKKQVESYCGVIIKTNLRKLRTRKSEKVIKRRGEKEKKSKQEGKNLKLAPKNNVQQMCIKKKAQKKAGCGMGLGEGHTKVKKKKDK